MGISTQQKTIEQWKSKVWMLKYYYLESLQNIFKWQKSNARNHLLFNFIYIKCPEEANLLKPKVDWVPLTTSGKELHDYKWHKGSFHDDKNVLKLDCNDGCSTLNLPKIIVQLNCTNFMIYTLCSPKAVEKPW